MSIGKQIDFDPIDTIISPTMVRNAIEELEKLRARVPISLLARYFQSRYPVTDNPSKLKAELKEQADRAVKLGWLRKFTDGSYCLSTLQWQASVDEYGFQDL